MRAPGPSGQKGSRPNWDREARDYGAYRVFRVLGFGAGFKFKGFQSFRDFRV